MRQRCEWNCTSPILTLIIDEAMEGAWGLELPLKNSCSDIVRLRQGQEFEYIPAVCPQVNDLI